MLQVLVLTLQGQKYRATYASHVQEHRNPSWEAPGAQLSVLMLMWEEVWNFAVTECTMHLSTQRPRSVTSHGLNTFTYSWSWNIQVARNFTNWLHCTTLKFTERLRPTYSMRLRTPDFKDEQVRPIIFLCMQCTSSVLAHSLQYISGSETSFKIF